MRRLIKPTAVLLVVTLLLQPFCTVPMLDRIFGDNTRVAVAQDDEGTIYLPIIAGGSGEPGGQTGDAPTFVINSPVAGSSVGGTTYFSIQPTNDETITTVTFRVGDTVLDSDTDGSNGFRVFLDARDFAAGATELSATANGPNGETTERITVTIVPNPPQSATVGAEGAVLASEIGSVISLLPGSVPDGTTVTIDELTQAETTERHGIDWESMGVTFLGAQDVQSSVPISGPFGMVSSAGFGNRVQPGQAVVNYRIAPDADGDGVDEIVVVNTASVAPNGDVIADPVSSITVKTVKANIRSSDFSSNDNNINGPPGTVIEIEGVGFNSASSLGNVARFQSSVNGEVIEVPGSVRISPTNSSLQVFSVLIPYMEPGEATVTLYNYSTGSTTSPLNITVEEPLPLMRPAFEVISDTLTSINSALDNVAKAETEDTVKLIVGIDIVKEQVAELRSYFQQLSVTPSQEEAKMLTEIATIFENSNIIEKLAPIEASTISDAADGLANIAQGIMGAGGVLMTIPHPGAKIGGAIMMGFGAALLFALGMAQLGMPSPGGNTTGMGAAPPPGGNGGGSAGGSGGAAAQLTASSLQQTSSVMVKIFSNGNATPFTGMTDPGGYFFVPFIPADEPFTALAIDTATGETRSFSGTGPKTGESVFMFFDFFHEETIVPSIQWDGGGDGTSWSDPQNWDTDAVPEASDRVLIDVGSDPTITYDEGNTAVISLVSAEQMEFTGGTLTINAKSTISGTLTMNGGFTLIADGLGASLTATAATVSAGANLTARNGGRINLPGLTRFDGDGGGFFTKIRAVGAGSRVDLSAVSQFSGNTFVNDATQVEARDGGQIDLSAVTAITTGKVQFTADGDNSAIDLGALTRFTRGGRGESLLEAVNGGNINVTNLTELRGVTLMLNGSGTLATGQITIFTGGKAEVIGTTPNFAAITDADGSSFIVKAGGKVSLPNVTTYAGDGEGSDFFTALEADGPGSVLDLSTLTVLDGNTFVNDNLGVSATAGGKIDLRNVTKIDVGKVQFTADGSNSTIDLSSLTRFARGGRGESLLKPIFNGTILAPQLTELRGIGLILDGTGTLATSQITIFTGGKAEVTATTPDFGNMTAVDGASFIVKAGGKVTLPNVTSYAGDGEGSELFTTLSADGAGSLLDLSTITTFAGNTFVNDNLSVEALNGGKIDLKAVNAISVGKVQFTAEDSGSLIDLSALNQFSRSGRGESFLAASQSGRIDLKNNTVTLQDVNLIVTDNGSYTIGGFQLESESTFSGSGTVPGNFINNGTVAPGASPGRLQIGGTYQQGITGTLAIELNGPSAGSGFDQLQVNGNATLGGTLELTLLNNYLPTIGDSFVILTAANVTGQFATVNGSEIDSSWKFNVTYNTNSVIVTVISAN